MLAARLSAQEAAVFCILTASAFFIFSVPVLPGLSRIVFHALPDFFSLPHPSSSAVTGLSSQIPRIAPKESRNPASDRYSGCHAQMTAAARARLVGRS